MKYSKETLKEILKAALDFEDGETGLHTCLELACEDLVTQAEEQYEIDNGFRARIKEQVNRNSESE